MGFLKRVQPAPSPPAKGLGERCKLPQRGLGGTQAAKRFSCILENSSGASIEAPDEFSRNFLGDQVRGALDPTAPKIRTCIRHKMGHFGDVEDLGDIYASANRRYRPPSHEVPYRMRSVQAGCSSPFSVRETIGG